MFIKLSDDQNAPVALTITIDGISHWNYTYNGDNPIFNSEKLNKPKAHELGVVSSLKGDVNGWIIELWNITDAEREVSVKLEWTGGVTKEYFWPKVGQTVTLPANGYKLLSGSIKFI